MFVPSNSTRTRKIAPTFWNSLGSQDSDRPKLVHSHRADVDFDAGQIITFPPQNSTGFAIPIFPQLRPLLKRFCEGKSNDERMFKIRDAKKALAGACQRLGDPSFSQLVSLGEMFVYPRHRIGIDVKIIAEWQGHRTGEI